MSIKILTKSGEEVTAIDDARAYNFDAGNKSGIVKGALNEGKLFLVSSNVIGLDSCELRISGHRIVIDSAESITMANRPSVATRYSMIAEVVVSDASVPSFRLFIQPAKTELIQQNLYKTLTGNGTYQIELGRFTLTQNGLIEDIVKTADVISGGSGNSTNTYIEIGEVKTNTISQGSQANVDVENVIDEKTGKTKTNFNFEIPATSGTTVSINGVEQENVSFESDPQTQITKIKDTLINKNLLINGDFFNYTRSWVIHNNFTTKQSSTGLDMGTLIPEGEFSIISQKIEYLKIDELVGKALTLSSQIHDYTGDTSSSLYGASLRIRCFSDNYESVIYNSNVLIKNGLNKLNFEVPMGTTKIEVDIYKNGTDTFSLFIDYIKLEVGNLTPNYPNVTENFILQKFSNSNLLINGDFRVNQRGQTNYITGGSTYIYSVDRWKLIGANLTTNSDKSVTLTNFTNYGRLIQSVEFFNYLKGKTVTLSVKFKNVSYTTESDPRLIINDGISNTISTTIPNGYSGIYTLTKTLDANATALDIRAIHNHLNTTTSDLSVTIEWVKLEVGSIATSFIPRLDAEELFLCQRYYQKIVATQPYGSFGNFLAKKGNNFGYFYICLPVELRTKPTLNYSGNFRAYGFGYTVNITSISIDQVSNLVLGARFDVASSYSAGDTGEISANNDSTAFIEFDAEIY